jgi:hypothetical protein
MVKSWIQELNSKYKKIRTPGSRYSLEDLNEANDAILLAISSLDKILKKPPYTKRAI